MISPDFGNHLKPYPTEFLKTVFQIFWWHFIKKWENIDTIRILKTISDFQLKHYSRRSKYSHVLFILFSCFSCGKFEKNLATCNVWKPSLSIFSFLTKEQKRKKEKWKISHF